MQIIRKMRLGSFKIPGRNGTEASIIETTQINSKRFYCLYFPPKGEERRREIQEYVCIVVNQNQGEKEVHVKL